MDRDKKTREDVEAELDFEPSLNAAAIGVAVVGGVVTLSGDVPAWGQRRRAEKAVLRITGVHAVVNDLEVRTTVALNPSDPSDLGKSVVDGLQTNLMVPSHRVQAIVSNGTVTLQGEVEWDFQRRAAQRVVRDLRGVRNVVSHIKVVPAAKPVEVERKVRAAFERRAALDADHVHVQVDHGHVTLTGHVSSWIEKKAATGAAWSAPGVARVTNKLNVESGVVTLL